jgi:hypothetical protein
MSDVVPSAAVVAAGNAPAFVLADIAIAEMLAALAPYTTPARFQTLLFSLTAEPEGLEWLKRKYECMGTLFLTGGTN